MHTNIFEIKINAPIVKVWEALTTKEIAEKWLPSVKVESNWRVGGDIVYTCVDKNGEVLEWEGMKMIWSGKIEVMDNLKEFTCVYDNQGTGIIKESHLFQEESENSTILKLLQTCTTEEIAEKYKSAMNETFETLKKYLESK